MVKNEIEKIDFSNYKNLGSRSFYCLNGRSDYCFSSFSEAVQDLDISQRSINTNSVLSILMKNYIVGDDTLIKGVQRTPWLSKPSSNGGWQRFDPPLHDSLCFSAEEIATKLKDKLVDEAMGFLSGKRRIGLLLSGGMDSRIVAGIVKYLQEIKNYSGDVVAISWGVDESRDLEYSKLIAQKYGWEFVRFELTPEVLYKNISLAGKMGAEFSPIHLHAMDNVSKIDSLDGILAGSYGDSIGRGEYSGKKVNQLKPILETHHNYFNLLHNEIEKVSYDRLKSQLLEDEKHSIDRLSYGIREIEMQEHYMRRQLNPCMNVIDDRINLYQMFTDPAVYSFMWSLSLSSRNDDIYYYLLISLPGRLLDIPWARTGQVFPATSSTPLDNFSSTNNAYGSWLRKELREYIINEIKSGPIQELGIFNDKSLLMWLKNWSTKNSPKADRVDERISWLASLSIAIREYNISGDSYPQAIISDYLGVCKAFLYCKSYYLAKSVLNK